MAARMAGGRKTPDRVVSLLQEEVKKTSQAATARATGLTLRGVQNYLKGIGEPTTASLEKIADYFGVKVAWLRGEEYSPAILKLAALGIDPEETQKYAEIYGDDEEGDKRHNLKEMTKLFKKLSVEEQDNMKRMMKCFAAFSFEQQQLLIASVMQRYFKLYGKPLEIHEIDEDNDGRYE
jgi:transcriptional regulator with XRE-family HTH domain